jgi:hypothetical protein
MPKKPSSAYLLFNSDKRKELRETFEKSGETQPEKVATLAKMWKEITPEEKAKYLRMAAEKKGMCECRVFFVKLSFRIMLTM